MMISNPGWQAEIGKPGSEDKSTAPIDGECYPIVSCSASA